jgi:hypothetical protein
MEKLILLPATINASLIAIQFNHVNQKLMKESFIFVQHSCGGKIKMKNYFHVAADAKARTFNISVIFGIKVKFSMLELRSRSTLCCFSQYNSIDVDEFVTMCAINRTLFHCEERESWI